jgi:Ca2+-binding EF-hand superfamily protein
MIQKGMEKENGGYMGFDEFLKIMQFLRELDRERLRKMVDQELTFRNGELPRTDIIGFLQETGVVPRSLPENSEIHGFVSECDVDGPSALAREEIVVLIQRVAARVRMVQHERELQYVLSCNWSEQQFADFRFLFHSFDEDMDETLDHDELAKAVDQFKLHYSQTTANMTAVFKALGIELNKEVKVTFLTFLRMVKMLEESEARRQQGMAAGFGRERTDRLHIAFQALREDVKAESAEDRERREGGRTVVRKERIDQALMMATQRFISKLQLVEVLRTMTHEDMEVDFIVFLRLLKHLEVIIEGDFDEFIEELVTMTQEMLVAMSRFAEKAVETFSGQISEHHHMPHLDRVL